MLIPICFVLMAVIAASIADHAEKHGRFVWLALFGLATLFFGLMALWSGFAWVISLDRGAYVN